MRDPHLNKQERRKELSAKLNQLGQEQQERLAEYRAEKLGLPHVSLTMFPINPEVIDAIDKDRAREAGAALFYKQGNDIRVGLVNPQTEEAKQIVEELAERFGREPQQYVISHRSLQAALNRYPQETDDVPDKKGEFTVTEGTLDDIADKLNDLSALGDKLSEMEPSQLLSTVIAGAVAMGASDLHIEPGQTDARLRYRIDGVLQDIAVFERDAYALIRSRVKVLAGLKLNVEDTPQDGSFVLHAGAQTYDVRLSTLPGNNGENIVMRLLSRASRALQVTELGMKQRDYELVKDALKQTTGMIVATGPTGSGKTTSLISFIQEVNEPELKIITLENPIEYRLEGVEHTQVDKDAGYTFAVGLRSILRQDPDVIMVGEMRDIETAETAVQAANTGHLVFSTLHTNDAAGAVPRLLDLGVKPFVLGPALNLVIAQRLVRVVCSECAEEYAPDEQLMRKIRDAMDGVSREVFNPKRLTSGDLTLVRAVGCSACAHTGYKGRTGVFEIFSVDGKMEELVLEGANKLEIQEEALARGMTTIAQDGYLKVLDHVTTVEEVERISEE